MGEITNNTGTYSHCSNCKLNKNCCCDFKDKIDDIIITKQEKLKILARVGIEYRRNFKRIKRGAYNIINVDGKCPFFDNGCTIYDIRPNDCRLFPYDLKVIKDKCYLVKYDLPCGSKNINENVDEIINDLCSILKIYTDENVNKKVNKLPYIIIKEINI